jgi:hypothetical protein
MKITICNNVNDPKYVGLAHIMLSNESSNCVKDWIIFKGTVLP